MRYMQLHEHREPRESYRNCIENNLTFDNYLNFIILSFVLRSIN